jgi:hypothetical protein
MKELTYQGDSTACRSMTAACNDMYLKAFVTAVYAVMYLAAAHHNVHMCKLSASLQYDVLMLSGIMYLICCVVHSPNR